MAPYTSSANDRFLKEHLSTRWPWRMFIFFLTIFLIPLFSYVGLVFGYSPYLEDSISKAESELSGLSLQVESQRRENFVEFYSQVANLKSLLGAHIATSKILAPLEASTHKQVAYSSMSLSVKEKTLRLEGFAASYEVLAAQLALYEQAPWVSKVVLDSSSLAESTVKFAVRLTIKNETFNL